MINVSKVQGYLADFNRDICASKLSCIECLHDLLSELLRQSFLIPLLSSLGCAESKARSGSLSSWLT